MKIGHILPIFLPKLKNLISQCLYQIWRNNLKQHLTLLSLSIRMWLIPCWPVCWWSWRCLLNAVVPTAAWYGAPASRSLQAIDFHKVRISPQDLNEQFHEISLFGLFSLNSSCSLISMLEFCLIYEVHPKSKWKMWIKREWLQIGG